MNTEVIALQTDHDEAGALVWWTLTGLTCILDMGETLEGVGLTDGWAPTPLRAETIIRRAALATAKDKRQLIRPLGKSVWEFVTETVVDDRLVYTPNVRISIDKSADRESPIEVVPQLESDKEIAAEITAKFYVLRGLMNVSDMSSWFIRMLTQKIDAVGLRERGGFYFVPKGEPLDTWRKVCEVVNAVSNHQMHSMPAMRCEDAIEAILHALRTESDTTMTQLDTYLSGDVSSRGLSSWEKSMASLRTKINRYRDLLGVELPELTGRAENLLGGLGAARMMHNAPDSLPEAAEAAQ